MILESLTENISKSYAIILMSFLRLWSDKMICNHDLKKIEILLKLLCFFSIIVFYMMNHPVIHFVIKCFAQINELKKATPPLRELY